MTKILYDLETMKFSTYFETLTRAKLKDCFKEGDGLTFIIMPGFLAKAIGKGGANIKKVSTRLNKQIKVIEFDEDVIKFIRKAIYPVKNVDIEQRESNILIHCPDNKTKGLVYGRERERLKNLVSLVKRYFKIDDIKID